MAVDKKPFNKKFSVNALPPPKIMSWSYNLKQTHCCNKNILITSGCSFTASTTQLKIAASWPGYLRDRCRFDYAVDLSYPGMGNDYICDTMKIYLESVDCSNVLVIVMWSGLDRVYTIGGPAFNLSPSQTTQQKQISDEEKRSRAEFSWFKIQELKDFLISRNIPHAFTQYINLLWPPYLAYRDTTKSWDSWLKKDIVNQIRQCIDVPTNNKDFLYDWAFYNGYLNVGDQYHPPAECNLDWTDQVLIPNLARKALIFPVDQK